MESAKTTAKDTAKDELKQYGRVIAQGMHEYNVQKEKNMASAAKRKETRLRNAAHDVFNRNY